MAIPLNDNIYIKAGKPSEPKYLNGAVPYISEAEVFSTIPISERHEGLKVRVGGDNYEVNPDLTSLKKLGVAGGPVLKSIHLRKTATKNFRNGNFIDWDTEDFKDSEFTHSNTVDSSRVGATVDGLFTFDINVDFDYNTTNRLVCRAFLYKNGNPLIQKGGQCYIRGSQYEGTGINISSSVFLVSGDYIEVRIEVVDADNGSSLVELEPNLCEFIVYQLATTAVTNTWRPEITDSQVLTKLLNNPNTEHFTTAILNEIGLNTADRHSHANKALLDSLTTLGLATQFLNAQGNYVTVNTSETLTTLGITGSNILRYRDELGNETDIDLSLYLDDTNLARIESGVLDPVTGIATFTRDDSTTFTLDLSSLIFAAATQVEAEGGTETSLRSWSPLRVKQAVVAHSAWVKVNTLQELIDRLEEPSSTVKYTVLGSLITVDTTTIDVQGFNYVLGASYDFTTGSSGPPPFLSVVGTNKTLTLNATGAADFQYHGHLSLASNLTLSGNLPRLQIKTVSGTGTLSNPVPVTTVQVEEVIGATLGSGVTQYFWDNTNKNTGGSSTGAYIPVSNIAELQIALSSTDTPIKNIVSTAPISSGALSVVVAGVNNIVGSPISISTLAAAGAGNINFYSKYSGSTIQNTLVGGLYFRTLIGTLTVISTTDFKYEDLAGTISSSGGGSIEQDYWENTNKAGSTPIPVEFIVNSDAPVSKWSRLFNGNQIFDSTSLVYSTATLSGIQIEVREDGQPSTILAGTNTVAINSLNTWIIAASTNYQFRVIGTYLSSQFGFTEITFNKL